MKTRLALVMAVLGGFILIACGIADAASKKGTTVKAKAEWAMQETQASQAKAQQDISSKVNVYFYTDTIWGCPDCVDTQPAAAVSVGVYSQELALGKIQLFARKAGQGVYEEVIQPAKATLEPIGKENSLGIIVRTYLRSSFYASVKLASPGNYQFKVRIYLANGKLATERKFLAKVQEFDFYSLDECRDAEGNVVMEYAAVSLFGTELPRTLDIQTGNVYKEGIPLETISDEDGWVSNVYRVTYTRAEFEEIDHDHEPTDAEFITPEGRVFSKELWIEPYHYISQCGSDEDEED